MKLVDIADEKIEPFYKGAPKLSDGSKETMVKAWPWIALIFGVLQVYGSLGLWRLAHPSAVSGAYYDSIYGHKAELVSGSDKFFIYIGLLVALASGIILLLAYQKLLRRLKSGWDLLYLGALINAAFAIVSLFIINRGFLNFIFSGAASVISFWLLYEVKDKYHRR